jgi:predicted nucleic acid-binding protein
MRVVSDTSPSGATGVLIAAKHHGLLGELKPELLALRLRARFFLSPSIFSEALASVGESV